MKKFLKFISILLSLILCVSILPACQDVAPTQVVLYDFETWKPDFSCIKGSTHFGVIKRNNDVEYCKSGVYSAKIMPIGGHINRYTDAPYCWFPTSSEPWGFNYKDFTFVEKVTCWVYNDTSEEKAVTMGLVDDYVTFEKTNRLPGRHFILKPNSWNELVLPINFNAWAANIDTTIIYSTGYALTDEDISKIDGVYFDFEPNYEPEPEFAPVYYFDDITLHYKKTANTAEKINFFDKNSPTRTLIDFENPLLHNAFDVNIYNYINEALARVVDDSELPTKATTGKNMYEITYNAFKYSEQNQFVNCDPSLQYWSYVELNETLVRDFFKTYVYDSELENPYIIPREDWDKWYLTYDVYNANAVEYNLDLRFYTKGEKNVLIKKTSGSVPNQWNTVRVSLEEIASGNDERVTNPGFIRLLWIPAPGTGASGKEDLITENFTRMKYYLDSFRLEQAPNA